MEEQLSGGGLGILARGRGVLLLDQVRGPRVAVGVLYGSEMGMFVGRPGERHSPLGSGVKLALCEEV